MNDGHDLAAAGTGTRLAHIARDPRAQHGFVNTPIHRGSTVLFPTLDALEGAMRVDSRTGPYIYGLMGNPNSRELETMLARLDGTVQKVYYLTCPARRRGYGIHGVDTGRSRGRLEDPERT